MTTREQLLKWMHEAAAVARADGGVSRVELEEASSRKRLGEYRCTGQSDAGWCNRVAAEMHGAVAAHRGEPGAPRSYIAWMYSRSDANDPQVLRFRDDAPDASEPRS